MSGRPLLTVTGGLDIGLPSGRVIAGAKAACREHRAEPRGFTRELRFPGGTRPATPGCVRSCVPARSRFPAGGSCHNGAHATLARKLGADLRENEPVRSWRAVGDRVEVETDRGRCEAGSLVLAAGAWTGQAAGPPARHWRSPSAKSWAGSRHRGPEFAPHAFPVFILDCPERGNFYGFPERGANEDFKLGKFRHRGEDVDPDSYRPAHHAAGRGGADLARALPREADGAADARGSRPACS